MILKLNIKVKNSYILYLNIKIDRMVRINLIKNHFEIIDNLCYIELHALKYIGFDACKLIAQFTTHSQINQLLYTGMYDYGESLF